MSFPKGNFLSYNFSSGNFPKVRLGLLRRRRLQGRAKRCGWDWQGGRALQLEQARGCTLQLDKFGTLLLQKWQIWEVTIWEIILGKLLLGKMPLGEYLTSLCILSLVRENMNGLLLSFINSYYYPSLIH